MSFRKASVFAAALTAVFLALIGGYTFSQSRITGDYRISVVTADKNDTEKDIPNHYIDGKLDINVADISELTLLPGIGEVLAGRIVEAREALGGFDDIEQLCDVEGIGRATFDGIEEFIIIGESHEDTGG